MIPGEKMYLQKEMKKTRNGNVSKYKRLSSFSLKFLFKIQLTI